ncbi:hypothetical protein C8R44DRAFT_731093 [Mycena epipterygia]|nr:hypothetical protein C8R44DRAFT_731093 [Mycena epipterygia]
MCGLEMLSMPSVTHMERAEKPQFDYRMVGNSLAKERTCKIEEFHGWPFSLLITAPFIQHEISAVAGPAQSLTMESMEDLNALPVLFNNDIQVDVEDGVMHFIAVTPTSMASLVSFYHHLNMKQLADIAASHWVHVPKMKPELPPSDALANFQYYTRAELPPGVHIAFETASMYDIMMVARARTTRITHLFSEKTKKEQPDEFTAVSQRYSKGNVAIFGHNVASLRTILLPPKQEIHEAMCTLFIDLSVAPTREKT